MSKKEARIALLKAMDNYVCNVIGDESIWETWIAVGVPDCASEDDFEFIAEDDSEWKDICRVFSGAVKRES